MLTCSWGPQPSEKNIRQGATLRIEEEHGNLTIQPNLPVAQHPWSWENCQRGGTKSYYDQNDLDNHFKMDLFFCHLYMLFLLIRWQFAASTIFPWNCFLLVFSKKNMAKSLHLLMATQPYLVSGKKATNITKLLPHPGFKLPWVDSRTLEWTEHPRVLPFLVLSFVPRKITDISVWEASGSKCGIYPN